MEDFGIDRRTAILGTIGAVIAGVTGVPLKTVLTDEQIDMHNKLMLDFWPMSHPDDDSYVLRQTRSTAGKLRIVICKSGQEPWFECANRS